MIITLQKLKDFENRCLGILIYTTNFNKNIDNHKTGHIRSTIQNIILRFGEDPTFVITKGEQIAQEVAIKSLTQSESWCPLIWKALSKCGYEIPNYEYFENPISNDLFVNTSLDFEQKITELSNIEGWCEYAVRVLNYEFNDIPLGSNDFEHDYVIRKSQNI